MPFKHQNIPLYSPHISVSRSSSLHYAIKQFPLKIPRDCFCTYMTTPVVSHMCRLYWPPKNWQNLGISRVSFNHHLYVAFSSALLTNEQMVPFKTLIFLFQDLRPGWFGGILPKAVSQQDRPVYRPQRITNMGDLPFGMKKIVISNFPSPDIAFCWSRKEENRVWILKRCITDAAMTWV